MLTRAQGYKGKRKKEWGVFWVHAKKMRGLKMKAKGGMVVLGVL